MPAKPSAELLYMNYMKFVGIGYLLIWHTAINDLNVFVVLFFLQMFFFISGYFYKDTYSEKPHIFIKKRIYSLYLPLIGYCSFFLLLNNFWVKINFYPDSMRISLKIFFHLLLQILWLEPNIQLAGGMWFVSSLFSTSIIFCGISAIVRILSTTKIDQKQTESIRFFMIVVFFIIGMYLSHLQIRLPAFLDISFVLLIFYYMGFLYKRYENNIPINLFLALSSFLILWLCTKYGVPQIVERQYINAPFLFIGGLAGIYFNLYLTKKFATYKNIKFVNYAGKNTMIILALHFLAFKSVSLIAIYRHNLPTDSLSSFPLLASTNQYYRWLYALSGLLLPLSGKYLFDLSYNKLKSL